jgi:hypothetical protein
MHTYLHMCVASYHMVRKRLSLQVKRPGREPDHSPPLSGEVKNAWSYTSTLPYVFMAWYLVKHRDNFLLYLTCVLTFMRTYVHEGRWKGSWTGGSAPLLCRGRRLLCQVIVVGVT